MSRIDLLVNQAIYLIILTDIILVTISTIMLLNFESSNFSRLTYLGYYLPGVTPQWAIDALPSGTMWQTTRSTFVEGWLTYIVLYNNFIPISMYVTLEVITYVHLFFVNEDKEIYYAEIDMPAKARSNNITDLGQVEYVFSDKTGTLTQNVMRFKRCSIGGRIYGAPVLETEATLMTPYVNIAQVNTDARISPKLDDFLKILSICHTVVVEKEVAETPRGAGTPTAQVVRSPKHGIEYQAESPDEKALVEAARDFDYELVGRTTSTLNVRIGNEVQSWTPLAVNKFDSERKRMSIIVKDRKGALRLLCKGADSHMINRGACETPQEQEKLVEHLKMFAQEGLRTLVLGYRNLTQAQYEQWLERYKAAANTAVERDAKLSAVASEIEKDLFIVGVTAIEDKLQDGVPDTIADLAAAGIKVCVLTGDKMETAINIGYSCKVLREGMTKLQLAGGSMHEVREGLCKLYKFVKEKKPDPPSPWGESKEKKAILAALHQYFPEDDEKDTGIRLTEMGGESQQRSVQVTFTEQSKAKGMLKAKNAPKSNLAFIMEGPALVYILGEPGLEAMLFEVTHACVAVIACRVSPKQKAQLVRMVKLHVKPVPVTLAIGDGANDVGMIQEAHVGVGISGNEGQQAVNASDFAIAQFRFLKRLVLVHGRWNYRRISKVVLYSFYKNVVLVMTLFFFCSTCGYSGTSVYEDNVLAGYNFFLGLPIFVLGLFDRDISAEYAMNHPNMYVSGRLNLDLSVFQVFKWIGTALIHGFFIYYFTSWSLSYGVVESATTYYTFGLGLYSVLLFSMQYKVGMEYRSVLRPQLLVGSNGEAKP
jgi:phospholipid-transporting ATPase